MTTYNFQVENRKDLVSLLRQLAAQVQKDMENGDCYVSEDDITNLDNAASAIERRIDKETGL